MHGPECGVRAAGHVSLSGLLMSAHVRGLRVQDVSGGEPVQVVELGLPLWAMEVDPASERSKLEGMLAGSFDLDGLLDTLPPGFDEAVALVKVWGVAMQSGNAVGQCSRALEAVSQCVFMALAVRSEGVCVA